VSTDQSVLAALQRVTDAALAFLSEDDLLRELLARITEILDADTAAVLLLDPSGVELRARAAKGIEEEVEQGVTIPVGEGFAGRVIAERRAIVIEALERADIANPILREKGIRSVLGVPLLIEGRPVGVLHVGTLSARVFTEADADLLQRVADRAALAIGNAQLFSAERAARQQLEALQRVTDAALAYLPLDDLLTELLERMTEILHSDTAAILMLDERAQLLRARAAKGIEEEVEQGVAIPVGKGFAGRIAAQRRSVTIADVDRADIANPILREKGIRSLLGVPLLIEGRVLGVLHVGSLTPRVYSDEERELLQLAADRAAVAIEHARLAEQHRLAEALQRRLLPRRISGIPGVEIATRYLPASEGLGGDWYDAFALGPGRIALAVGDVVGHGLSAAAVMAQLRTALRAYAVEGHSPSAVVERVNLMMWQIGPAAMTTLAYLVLDPLAETVELITAGHPPPLVIGADGSAEYLPLTGGVALGVLSTARFASATHPLPLGATVVLYTDGLVEDRKESIDVGLERLRTIAARTDDPEALCDALTTQLVPEAPADDIAMIVARLPAVPDRLTGTWPTDKDVLADIRMLLRRWLREHGAAHEEAYDILVASQEACANAVEHAYGPGMRSFELDAVCEGDVVTVTVRDQGRWRPPRGANRGRGLPMMQALMERVDIAQTETGTVVVLERTLGRKAA
jgi:serine phosphatase RsbU (regulator of sigma subunit)/anti-sigma regulatory factor (Ser/Thr protein kinase)/CBS domain-containing protein